MQVVFQHIGDGAKKFLIGYPVFVTDALKEVISLLDATVYYIDPDFYQDFYNSLPKVWTKIGKIIPASNLDTAICVPKYREIIGNLIEEIKREDICYVLLNSNMWHPKYLTELKALGIVLTTKIVDDPEGSMVYSRPIVRFYDKCICSGIDYDKHRTISEMYYKWGAKEVKFLPVFIDPRHYDDDAISYASKDIDIIHVGSFNWKRWIYLHRLYRRFGNRVKLYSHYDPRHLDNIFGYIYKVLNLFFPLPSVKNITDKELKSVYKRSKIGFNRHLSYGPSNARSYELCLNGVLQITDNPKGYQSLYDVGKEIICYNNINEALEKIEYYLKNNFEREKIARAGYSRAVSEYTYEAIFYKHLEYILEKP